MLPHKIPAHLLPYRVVLNLDLLTIAQYHGDRRLRSGLLHILVVLGHCFVSLCVLQLFDLIAQNLELMAERAFCGHHVLHSRIWGRRGIIFTTRESTIAVTKKWIIRS
jgi:hypothetical protein